MFHVVRYPNLIPKNTSLVSRIVKRSGARPFVEDYTLQKGHCIYIYATKEQRCKIEEQLYLRNSMFLVEEV